MLGHCFIHLRLLHVSVFVVSFHAPRSHADMIYQLISFKHEIDSICTIPRNLVERKNKNNKCHATWTLTLDEHTWYALFSAVFCDKFLYELNMSGECIQDVTKLESLKSFDLIDHLNWVIESRFWWLSQNDEKINITNEFVEENLKSNTEISKFFKGISEYWKAY